GLDIEVLDRDAMVEAGLGGLLGVARGSYQEPKLVKLEHRPDGRAKGHVVLVGKGITFDAGGLSIKTATGMEKMKGDMAGAATVLGAMSLVPTLAPRVRVTAYLPLTDNMLGPDAMRVGDVLRIRGGRTVEVLNTDAEGRLILADALALAVEDEPDAIVDLATLTGACMVALGDRTAGLFGNHEALSERLLDAAEAAGEAVWPLPMPDHLRKPLDSEIADLRNIGTGGYGGASTAAIFLREFVGDVPWAHLDIAGPADASSAYDEVSKGGTGFGVRTLVRLLAGWSRLPAAPAASAG
ncbi:MAG TPA: leucyl aminopeptidase, partial [Aquihabitans sp.]|nr:leucyl aminopeptidase [Aquihabitans sp.]